MENDLAYEFNERTSVMPKKITMPVTPIVFRKKTMPQAPVNSRIGLSNFQASKIPDYKKQGQKLEKSLVRMKDKNWDKALKLLETAQNCPFKCALPQKPKICQVETETYKFRSKAVPKFKHSVTIKKNGACLMREAATLVKRRESELKKLEELLNGGFDDSKISALEEEICKTREQQHIQEIERKHLEGLLTFEEAQLARKKVRQANQENMEKFKEERIQLLQELFDWKVLEREKIKKLVEKSHDIEKSAKEAEQRLLEEKQSKARLINYESKKILQEINQKREEELAEKVKLIQELRSLQQLRSLNIKEFDPTECPNFGLMCEMSIAELRERLNMLKIEMQEELEERKKVVLAERERKEHLLDNVKEFILQSRIPASKPTQTTNLKLEETTEILTLRERLEQAKQMNAVNLGSPAEKAGLLAGDSVIKINATEVYNLRHKDAQDVIIRAGPSFEITVHRGGTTWKPSVTPLPKAATNNYSTVTKTSLAAKPQSSIGSIGTGHNLSAKPFSPQVNGAVNGGPKLVNKQYNTPVGLYSEESIAETLSAQAEVLSTGVLGVNFKKNEKNYDASNSAVFRMVHEADKEPRDQEAEPDAGVITVPLGTGGLKHVQAPETKPVSTAPQLPPGQNICAELNRQNYYATQSHAIGGCSATPRSNTPLSERSNSRQGFGEYAQRSDLCDQGMTICSDCNRVIVGVFVRIKDKNLHVECFKCATCGSSLKNVGYYNINQKLYCDIHAKLAAKSNPPAPNLIPVTVPPGGKAPAGTITAALASHTLPTPAPVSPGVASSNITAQPFQSGSSFSSPRPFSSVSAPLSPPGSAYSTLPKSFSTAQPHSSPAPSSEKVRSIQNIIWPPSINSDEPELPTATPLYFPPQGHIKSAVSSKETEKTSNHRRVVAKETINTKTANCATTTESKELAETEELSEITKTMEANMSLCTTEVASLVERQVAIERIETAAETQMFVESVLQQRPNLPPPLNNLQPKVEVETEPLVQKGNTEILGTNESPSNTPRVVTRVCVCTNSCCNANSGELCKSCPMRDLNTPKDYQKCKLKPVENATPKRFGSPIITGVSVTINNPGKIKEAVKDLFTQIPDKKPASALGSALVTAPKEPFRAADVSDPTKSVPLPEETTPYLPPERPTVIEPKPQPPPKPKPQQPDTPFVSALRIAPDRPYTPIESSAPVKKKKPKEDPLLKDLPKPVQWMSMVTALTTAPERPYSPLIAESSTKTESSEVVVSMEQISKTKEIKQAIVEGSVQNEKPKPYTQPKRLKKFEPTNNTEESPKLKFPPISDDLKAKYEFEADYSEIKNEISEQIIEQTSMEKSYSSKTESEIKEIQYSNIKQGEYKKQTQESKSNSKITEEGNVIEKQTEETVFKKPLELTGYLQKRDYLPQYQMSLNYDETIQLPHHKDIKKLLSDNQNKQSMQNSNQSLISAHHSTQSSSHYASTSSKQSARGGDIRIPEVVFEPVREDKLASSTFSPRPGSLTPSMINKPAPVLPYYQENLVPTQMPPPTSNILDPQSPNISRSPSPCPYSDRPSSPFGRLSPRPISPAAGPPPNPLKEKQPHYKFTKEHFEIQKAKENISEYIPQFREKVDGIKLAETSEKSKLTSCQDKIIQDSHVKMHRNVQFDSVMNNTTQCTKQEHVKDRNTQLVSSKIKTQATELAKEKKADSHEALILEKKQTPSLSSEFRRVKNPDVTEPGVLGVRLTNPQPIVSPFIQKNQTQLDSTQIQSTPSTKPNCQLKGKGACATDCKSNVKQCESALTKITPGVSVNTSTLSQPNTGASGGRQAGAIGVAPKRGRGILNVGGLIGSRIAICGYCHGQIRYLGTQWVAFAFTYSIEISLCKQSTKNNVDISKPIEIVSQLKDQEDSDNDCVLDLLKPADMLTLDNPCDLSNAITLIPEQISSESVIVKPEKLLRDMEKATISCMPCTESDTNTKSSTNNISLHSNLKICCVCNTEIQRGPFITALGKIWCPEHFICNTPSCKRPLQDLGFVEEQGQLYCEYCFEQYIAPPCAKCGSKIKGDCLKAIGKNFHPECFSCSYCGKLFGNSPFFLEDGLPYCDNDWNELFTTKCFACGFPVEAGDRWVEALNNNYHSQCFNCTKSVINSLVDQAIKLAHPDFRKENLSKVKTILEKNSYPKEFYNKLITKRINKIYNTGTKSNNNIYHTIPYINNLSDTIKHELKKSDIHITFIPTNNRHLFTNLKTPIKHGNQSNVVYKLDCKDCNKCYIGQTKQYLKKRIYNHQYTVTHNVTAETALSKHSKDRRHNFDFRNTKILRKENNYKKRSIYKMIYIKKDENAVNFRTDIDHLSVIYNNLIHA
ncbi:pdz and lim domain protein zasp [Holotrichia oblita]|uniref:Pdz and lim domain protein zasp n=1 Tax=Holotrichia oblita TaxID=644536 RepID=A0ACB9TDS1_HOLOL|nr:pdz and lim domain protein zasp [Holotrichia oblita]